MTVETGDILKVVIDYFYPGAGTALNIFYYKLFDASQEDDDVLDALEAWALDDWGDEWKDLAPTNATLNNIDVQIVSETGEILRNVGVRVIDLLGVEISDVSPAAVSAYLLAFTSTPQVRGHKYVPGVSEFAITNGLFSGAAAASMGLLLLAYLQNVNIDVGVNLVPGVISTKLEDFTAFQDDGSFNLLPAYQRRRKAGVGS